MSTIRFAASILLLSSLLGRTALAQDEAAAEEPSAAEASEASEPAEESGTESAGESTEEAAPWKLYAGFDYELPTLSLSDPALVARFGAQELDSTLLRLRGGVRLFDWIGVELQLGSGIGDAQTADEFDVSGYAGLFVVPTGLLFDMVEFGALIGLTQLKAERGAADESFTGQAYGLNVELPLRAFGESMPDLRLGGGYLIINHNNAHRIYGAHLGLRYDFSW